MPPCPWVFRTEICMLCAPNMTVCPCSCLQVGYLLHVQNFPGISSWNRGGDLHPPSSEGSLRCSCWGRRGWRGSSRLCHSEGRTDGHGAGNRQTGWRYAWLFHRCCCFKYLLPLTLVPGTRWSPKYCFIPENLADYKRLRGGVKFISEFPLTAFGKILKRAVKDSVQKELNASKKEGKKWGRVTSDVRTFTWAMFLAWNTRIVFRKSKDVCTSWGVEVFLMFRGQKQLKWTIQMTFCATDVYESQTKSMRNSTSKLQQHVVKKQEKRNSVCLFFQVWTQVNSLLREQADSVRFRQI